MRLKLSNKLTSRFDKHFQPSEHHRKRKCAHFSVWLNCRFPQILSLSDSERTSEPFSKERKPSQVKYLKWKKLNRLTLGMLTSRDSARNVLSRMPFSSISFFSSLYKSRHFARHPKKSQTFGTINEPFADLISSSSCQKLLNGAVPVPIEQIKSHQHENSIYFLFSLTWRKGSFYPVQWEWLAAMWLSASENRAHFAQKSEFLHIFQAFPSSSSTLRIVHPLFRL